MKMKDLLDSIEPEKKVKKKKKLKKEAAKKKKPAKESPKKKAPEEAKKLKAVKPSAPKQPPESVEIEARLPEATKAVDESAKAAPSVSTTESSKTVVTKTPPPEAVSAQTSTTDISRNRVSKNLQVPSATEQRLAINTIVKQLILGEITQGFALRELRVKVLGIRQESFANQVGVSRKTLSEIENNKGNYTSEIINKVFQPFELQVGLVPTSSMALVAMFKS
ncbi:helix-turn-helix transcriptional regulator [Marinomonas dokdonensis]|uniref:helix-turn-helix transcriptional regulator n=1 Tax=Marinomonas dokdonensis TaxID=328224 RepID=UPI0040553B12